MGLDGLSLCLIWVHVAMERVSQPSPRGPERTFTVQCSTEKAGVYWELPGVNSAIIYLILRTSGSVWWWRCWRVRNECPCTVCVHVQIFGVEALTCLVKLFPSWVSLAQRL